MPARLVPHRRLEPGDHDLARSVEVDGFDDFALRGFATRRLDLGVIEAKDRRHCALVAWYGGLHYLPAETHQVHGHAEIERIRTDERGVLAQAVARHGCGPRSAVRAPHAPGRHTGCQHRRLRALGRTQVGLGAVSTQLPEIVAEHLGCLGKGLLNQRFLRGERREHADRL